MSPPMSGVEDNKISTFVLLRRSPDQIKTESFFPLCSIFIFQFPFLNQERRDKELHCTIIVLKKSSNLVTYSRLKNIWIEIGKRVQNFNLLWKWKNMRLLREKSVFHGLQKHYLDFSLSSSECKLGIPTCFCWENLPRKPASFLLTSPTYFSHPIWITHKIWSLINLSSTYNSKPRISQIFKGTETETN